MKNLINNVFLVAAFAILLASCKPELTTLTASKGSLNLTSYVAVGNSLTSGYQNNGLFREGQLSSYVNVLADQFKIVQKDLVFKTPLVGAGSVGCGAPNLLISPALPTNLNNPAALLPLLASTFTLTIAVPAPYTLQTVTTCGVAGLAPAPAAAFGDISIMFDPSNTGYDASKGTITRSFTGASLLNGLPDIKTAASIYDAEGPFQNVGVPGARCVDVNRQGFGGASLITLNGTTPSQSNPFFSRFAKNQATSTMLSDAMLLKPTFFSLFIGNNDVLLWASQGGEEGLTATPITPTLEFTDSITNIVKTLASSASQGILVNIPQITGAAFFTFEAPDVTKYLIDETGATRLATANDMFLLTMPQDSLHCGLGGFGTAAHPIPKKYTLTSAQVTQATTAIDEYNAVISKLASDYNLAFFDMNAFTKANQTGTVYNSMDLTGEFVTGGVFSLDGLHLTPRGYAAVANEMIKVINTKYGSTIPGVDLTKFNGVNFPE